MENELNRSKDELQTPPIEYMEKVVFCFSDSESFFEQELAGYLSGTCGNQFPYNSWVHCLLHIPQKSLELEEKKELSGQ